MQGSFDFRSARVLVTGGTSGIGAAVATAYRDAGASVTITGTRSSADQYGPDIQGLQYSSLDITDAASIATVAGRLSGLDILVHCGGIALASIGLDESEPQNFAKAVEMHLTGVYRLTHACLPMLKASQFPGGASVIGIASMSSYFGMPIVPGYGAAKAGLVQLMKTMAVTWADHGIRANAVAAGLVASRQTAGVTESPEAAGYLLQRTPLKRIGQPADVAGPVLFLSSPLASYITGQTLPVDGGYSIAG